MSATVVSLVPFIATVPVCVELLLVTMEVTLCFGPFNSHEEGKNWVSQFELIRAELEAEDPITVEGVFAGAELSTRPFVDAHTYVCDVLEAGREARRADGVIPHGDPTIAAKNIHIYALRALSDAVAFGLEHVEGDEQH